MAWGADPWAAKVDRLPLRVSSADPAPRSAKQAVRPRRAKAKAARCSGLIR